MRKIFKNIFKNDGVQTFITSSICVFIGLLIGFLILFLVKKDPYVAWQGIKNIIFNSNVDNIGVTLAKTAPLILCSLSVLFSYKAGFFNIGVAGQYLIGFFSSAYVAICFGWVWWGCVLFGAVAGALYGALVGILKAFKNVNEVIAGILLNWIALYFVTFIGNLSRNTFYAIGIDSHMVPYDAKLVDCGLQNILGVEQVTIAIPLSIIIAFLIWILLKYTKLGFEIRAIGLNRDSAKYCGMSERRNIVLLLTISGGLAGLAGTFFYLSGIGCYTNSSILPEMGFNGIAGAFLGALNPIGCIFSSYILQHLIDGGGSLSTIGCNQHISTIISSIIIYLCAFVPILKMIVNKMQIRYVKKETFK